MAGPTEPKNYQDPMVCDYAGDGVYVVNEGHCIELRANNHENPTDRIVLEPAVFKNLLRIADRWEYVDRREWGKLAT